MAQIPQLQSTNTLGTDDQAILRQGTIDKRISLELAGTLSWAKRNGFTHVGSHVQGLSFSSTEDFSTFQGKVYFVKASVSLPYTSTTTDPSTETDLYTKDETSLKEVIATGSTVSRSLSNRFADIVNVKDFGAVGDGITDDTDAIQVAISQGGKIAFPTGVYIISDEITISVHGTKLVGEGSAWIKLQDGDYSSYSTFAFLKSNNVDEIDIIGLSFDGNRANCTPPSAGASTVWLTNTNHSNILNCRAKNPFGGSTGLNAVFSFIDSSYNNTCNNNHVWCDILDTNFGLCGAIFMQGGVSIADSNTISNMNDAVIVANGPGSRTFVFSNNITTNINGGHIVAENGASDVSIIGNTLHELSNGYGIAVLWLGTEGSASDGVTIVGNTIRGSNGNSVISPISITTGQNITVSSNTIRDIDIGNVNNTLIYIKDNLTTTNVKAVISNNSIQGGVYGISLNGCSGVEVSNNNVASTTAGIRLRNALIHCDVSNNIIRGATTGILGDATYVGTDVNILSNIITATTNISLVASSGTRLEIDDNVTVFHGVIVLPSAVVVPAGGFATVNLDIGIAAHVGGTLHADTYAEGTSSSATVLLTFAGLANSNQTVSMRAYNYDTESRTVSSVRYRVYGRVVDYNK